MWDFHQRIAYKLIQKHSGRVRSDTYPHYDMDKVLTDMYIKKTGQKSCFQLFLQPLPPDKKNIPKIEGWKTQEI